MTINLREKEISINSAFVTVNTNHKYIVSSKVEVVEVPTDENKKEVEAIQSLIEEQIVALKALSAAIKN